MVIHKYIYAIIGDITKKVIEEAIYEVFRCSASSGGQEQAVL